MVINEAKAVSTDTIHRLKFKTEISPLVLSAGFINSLTFAFSEISGRSYGGGVLELEPNEAEQILIPTLENFSIDHHIIDELLRKGEIEKALDIVDEALLVDLLGFDKKVVLSLREIWKKLSNRRLNRK